VHCLFNYTLGLTLHLSKITDDVSLGSQEELSIYISVNLVALFLTATSGLLILGLQATLMSPRSAKFPPKSPN
jgi:hypothetical protein